LIPKTSRKGIAAQGLPPPEARDNRDRVTRAYGCVAWAYVDARTPPRENVPTISMP
jgi:hypothetical protein